MGAAELSEFGFAEIGAMENGRATRREFVGTLAAAAMALPMLGTRTAQAAGDTWIATVKPEDLAAGSYRVYKKEGFALSRVGDKVMALDATCTHKACAVKPGTDKKDKDNCLLACPCHGGKFDAEGNVAGGPPKSALARHPLRLRADGVIEVNAGAKVAATAAEGVLNVK